MLSLAIVTNQTINHLSFLSWFLPPAVNIRVPFVLDCVISNQSNHRIYYYLLLSLCYIRNITKKLLWCVAVHNCIWPSTFCSLANLILSIAWSCYCRKAYGLFSVSVNFVFALISSRLYLVTKFIYFAHLSQNSSILHISGPVCRHVVQVLSITMCIMVAWFFFPGFNLR